jgi:hypothetical protein
MLYASRKCEAMFHVEGRTCVLYRLCVVNLSICFSYTG